MSHRRSQLRLTAAAPRMAQASYAVKKEAGSAAGDPFVTSSYKGQCIVWKKPRQMRAA
jgi:hypothetical protein